MLIKTYKENIKPNEGVLMDEKNNIKKKKTGNIYWGISVPSGECVHISSVESGLACQCKCVACGEQLEARKGSRRRHHFAHISNYECLYAYEVSVYKAVESILAKKQILYIPEAILRFNSNKESEIIKRNNVIDIDSLEFHCEPRQYPPELILLNSGAKLRVILEFGGYYAQPDEEVLAKWAKEHGMACLLIQLPHIDKSDDYDSSTLEELLLTANEHSKWIYNRRIEEAHKKFEDKAFYAEPYGGGYLCSAHKDYYKGKYAVRWDDCVGCEYCFEISPSCRCLAKSGVVHYSDLAIPEHVRIERMRDTISHNEQEIQEQKRRERAKFEAEQRRREQEKSLATTKRQLAADKARIEARRRTHINQANYESGYSEVIQTFDANGGNPTYDSFGTRWCICTRCGEVKHTGVMASYGFGGPNKGLCSDCARK